MLQLYGYYKVVFIWSGFQWNSINFANYIKTLWENWILFELHTMSITTYSMRGFLVSTFIFCKREIFSINKSNTMLSIFVINKSIFVFLKFLRNYLNTVTIPNFYEFCMFNTYYLIYEGDVVTNYNIWKLCFDSPILYMATLF